MGQVERPKVTVGFIPLIDCAPVLFAEVLGLYERHGLEVELRREVSWSNIRDKLAVGLLDAAHMLSPHAARHHARHRQRQRPDDRGHDAAAQRQLDHAFECAVARDRGRGARVRRRQPAGRCAARRARAGRRRRAPRKAGPPAGHARVGLYLFLAQSPAAPVAGLGRHRSGSRRALHRRAAAAHGGASLGRHDRRLLRRRAVEPAVRLARHRPHRRVQPADLELDAGEDAGHDRGLGAAKSEDADRAGEGASRKPAHGSTSRPTVPRRRAFWRRRASSTCRPK